MGKNKTKTEQIIEEIAYDLDLDKNLVRQVVKETFVEIVSSITLRKQHVLLRGFAKLVVSGISKNKYKSFDPMQYETRNEEDWVKQKEDERKESKRSSERDR